VLREMVNVAPLSSSVMTSCPVGRVEGEGDLVGAGPIVAGEAEACPVDGYGCGEAVRSGYADGVRRGVGVPYGVEVGFVCGPPEGSPEGYADHPKDGDASLVAETASSASSTGVPEPERRLCDAPSPHPPSRSPASAAAATYLMRSTVVGRTSPGVRFQ